MIKNYIASIANIIKNYRGYKFKSLDENHVRRWINQFDSEEDKEIVLSQTYCLLDKYYFSDDLLDNRIISILRDTSIIPSIKDTYFFNIQSKGTSQSNLYNKVVKIAMDLFNFDISNNKIENCNYFIYFDDALFSGITFVKDINKVFELVGYDINLKFLYLATHSKGVFWATKKFKELYPNIDKNIFSFISINNSICTSPIKTPLGIRENMSNVLNNINILSDNFFQNLPLEDKFSIILFEKGLYIISNCNSVKDELRPMGYDKIVDNGFGGFFATDMNISNNCPLAFWWGDIDNSFSLNHPFSKWYPLLPRKVNNNE